MTHEERKHRDETAKRLSSEGRKYFDLIEFDPDEQMILEIRKHPFGLFLVWLVGGFIGLVTLVVMIFIVQADLSDLNSLGDEGMMKSIIVLLTFLVLIGTIVGTFISAYLYKSNVIYITNEKIAQVLFVGLFNRKISQLSVGDVQDVTVRQNGILPHIFKYGTLVIETAGEQENYTFTYVPDPYQTSKSIVSSHEQNLKLHGN